ncbi:MAG: F0F1 ATP synthase subunit B [Bacillota bacterium]|nr:F0F1 ATP synthase subunit B [Bacillota bacterium]
MEAEIYTPLISFNWTLPLMWVNILILYLVMKKFFWEKIRNFMQAREAAVRESLENADSVNRLADDKLADYERRIADIESEGREIIKAAKAKADAQAKSLIEEAEAKAASLILQARNEIQLEKTKALAEMKEQVADLAILAAEKILEKELDAAGQQTLITDIIEEAGRSQWQN